MSEFNASLEEPEGSEPPHDQSQGPKRKPGPNDLTPEQRIDALAQEPLLSTGKLPSPEAVQAAKRIANEIGEGARPGVESASSPASVPERTQQERDSANVPAPALPAASSPQPVDEASIPAELMHGEETPPEPLPPDIEAVWGGGRRDGMGLPAANTARHLIAAWGLDPFRASAIHQAAIKDADRERRMEPVRKAFIEAQTKKEKKK